MTTVRSTSWRTIYSIYLVYLKQCEMHFIYYIYIEILYVFACCEKMQSVWWPEIAVIARHFIIRLWYSIKYIIRHIEATKSE